MTAKGARERENLHGLLPRRLQRSDVLRMCWMAFVLALFSGCAPVQYSVHMRYLPTGGYPRAESVAPPVTVTVAAFQDLRRLDDPIVIGKVITSKGEEIRVLPKFVMPSEAITVPFKDYFRQTGYQVSAESPAWDLKEENIRKEWGPVLVGGSIDELEVLCRRSITVQKYTAKVRLTMFVADARQQKVRYRVTTDSSDSLDHILFSEERLEQQLNIAVSEAINKILEDNRLAKVIQEIAAERP